MTTDTALTTAHAGPAVRLPVDVLSAATNRAMASLDAAARRTDLDAPLQELVRTRVSQINGCAYCVDMHSTDAVDAGVPERKLHALAVWRETPFYTDRERAALELAEAMTRLSEAPITDALFERVGVSFSDKELSDLIWLITVINAWSRLGATTHAWPIS